MLSLSLSAVLGSYNILIVWEPIDNHHLILLNSTTKVATKAMMMATTIHSHAAAITPSAEDVRCTGEEEAAAEAGFECEGSSAAANTS